MKLLGLSCGKKMGDSESSCGRRSWLRSIAGHRNCRGPPLARPSIEPCTGCMACLVGMDERRRRPLVQHKEDDFAFIEDKIYECDAIPH